MTSYLLIMSPQSSINFDLHFTPLHHRPFHLEWVLSIKRSAAFQRNFFTDKEGERWKRRKSERPWQSSEHEPTRFSLFFSYLSCAWLHQKNETVYSSFLVFFNLSIKISSTHDGISKATDSRKKGKKEKISESLNRFRVEDRRVILR